MTRLHQPTYPSIHKKADEMPTFITNWLNGWSLSQIIIATLVAAAIITVLVFIGRLWRTARRAMWKTVGAIASAWLISLVPAIVHIGDNVTVPTSLPSGTHTVLTTTGQIVTVADGDTFTIRPTGGQNMKVRILGIDAPEVAHNGTPADCGGDLAAETLKQLLPVGTVVTVTTSTISDQQDRYGRTLAYAATRTTPDIGLAQIQAGMAEAWVPSGEPHPERWEQYTAAQTLAQTSQTGAWGGCETLGR